MPVLRDQRMRETAPPRMASDTRGGDAAEAQTISDDPLTTSRSRPAADSAGRQAHEEEPQRLIHEPEWPVRRDEYHDTSQTVSQVDARQEPLDERQEHEERLRKEP